MIAAMVTGVVREWWSDEGWGVIDADETPGGCWAHFLIIDMPGHVVLRPGQRVELCYEHPGQDGHDYRATSVAIPGVPPGNRRTEPPGPGYRSGLHIKRDDGS
jgi:CspA family cold shock protein